METFSPCGRVEREVSGGHSTAKEEKVTGQAHLPTTDAMYIQFHEAGTFQEGYGGKEGSITKSNK